MSGLRPFFTYFGGKWRAAPKYPPPIYDTIVEPFAGSAGYSLRYPERKIILVEKSPAIAGIWRYLIGASEKDILSLPLLEPGQSTDTLDVCQEARWLIGMWVSAGSGAPKKTLTEWAQRDPSHHKMCVWGKPVRARLASQIHTIRHWRIIEGDYSAAPDTAATWFIDPPYEGMGKHYPCGSDEIDFASLGDWCRARRGQVLVCEAQGANRLPFPDFGTFKSNNANHQGRTRSAEALWMNDWPGAALWLPAKESA